MPKRRRQTMVIDCYTLFFSQIMIKNLGPRQIKAFLSRLLQEVGQFTKLDPHRQWIAMSHLVGNGMEIRPQPSFAAGCLL